MTNLNELAKHVHLTARQHGFYESNESNSVATKIALIHSEASEALEAYRRDEMAIVHELDMKPEGFPIELADIIIRVCDLAAWQGIDLDAAVAEKAAFNECRPWRHGGRRI